MVEQDFSLSAYARLLFAIKNKSTIVSFNEAAAIDKALPITIIRHDVDLCLTKALEIAEYENALGVNSTFFLMTQNPLYSLDKKQNINIIENIEKLGHSIGLHFDPHNYEKNGALSEEDLEGRIGDELDFLSKFTTNPPTCLSFHRPSKRFVNGKTNIAGLLNAYTPRFMEFYISDSSRFWRCGCPVKAVVSSSYSIGQVLTHPLWWNTKNLSAKNSLNLLCERLAHQFVGDKTEIRDTINKLIPKVDF